MTARTPTDLDDLRSAATSLWARGLRAEHFAVQDAIRELDRLRTENELMRGVLGHMWQAYADQQCGWQDAATYHGHSACSRNGLRVASQVFDGYLPVLSEIMPTPKAPHFESQEGRR